MAGTTRILSWNVNGVRALLGRGSLAPLLRERPDILCLQETKAEASQVTEGLPASLPYRYWASALKKGYSGTAILTRREPLSVRYGMGSKEHDGEGRLVTVETPGYWVVSVYTPNAQRGLLRLDYRLRWERAFRAWLGRLAKSKPVVFCGDLNVAHEEIDLANPQANRKNAGFSDEERRELGRTLAAGYVDTYRALHPGKTGQYTWWSTPQNARARNVGWRIDYVCVSASLAPRVKDAFIRAKILGSDHCPVGIVLEERV